MFQAPKKEDLIAGIHALPKDVSALLGDAFETEKNLELVSHLKLDPEKARLLNAFYLGLLFKKIPLASVVSFVNEEPALQSGEAKAFFLSNIISRLYQYGDYLPELSQLASQCKVALPKDPPLILSVREALRKEVEAEQQEIAALAASVNKTAQKTIRQMPLLKALALYPRLQEQILTRERIALKNQPDTVRPSIANWMRSYRDELGVGVHSQVERGKFLFHSQNGKALSDEERSRLNLLIRSIEEDLPLAIDTELAQIVFPKSETGPTAASARSAPTPQMAIQGSAGASPKPTGEPFKLTEPNKELPGMSSIRIMRGMNFGANGIKKDTAPSPAGNFSFTTKHVLPAEKDKIVITNTPANSSQSPPAPVPPHPDVPHKPNPFQIHPVSLGPKKFEPSQKKVEVVKMPEVSSPGDVVDLRKGS